MRTETLIQFTCKLEQAYKVSLDFHLPEKGIHTQIIKVGSQFRLVTNDSTGTEADKLVARVELALEPKLYQFGHEVPPQGVPRPVKVEPVQVDFEKSTKINGFDILLHGEWEQGDFVTWCHVTFMNKYGSSLTLLDNEGFIESDRGEKNMNVPDRIVRKIYQWAEANGY